jgi:hypothetical protein
MKLENGQRVQHALYGTGVTTLCTDVRTTIAFDEHGVKTFVASMLQIEILSAPGTWVADGRGKPHPKTETKPGAARRT